MHFKKYTSSLGNIAVMKPEQIENLLFFSICSAFVNVEGETFACRKGREDIYSSQRGGGRSPAWTGLCQAHQAGGIRGGYPCTPELLPGEGIHYPLVSLQGICAASGHMCPIPGYGFRFSLVLQGCRFYPSYWRNLAFFMIIKVIHNTSQ